MNEQKLYQIIIALLIATIIMLGFMVYGNYKIEKQLKQSYIVPYDSITECNTDYECESLD